MKLTYRVMATACMAAFLSFAPAAMAQDQGPTGPACPASVTNPLTILAGTWTYSLSGFVGTPRIPFDSAGQFTAALKTVNGVANSPALSIVQTTSDGARLETAIGQYQIFPDCSGGTLIFYTSSRGFLFDFWFANSFTEIRMIAVGPNTYVNGSAKKF